MKRESVELLERVCERLHDTLEADSYANRNVYRAWDICRHLLDIAMQERWIAHSRRRINEVMNEIVRLTS